MDPRGIDKIDELPSADTPEDVAVLYSWANLHGAKYRDFSASRREYRAQLRHRAAEQVREQELKAQADAEAAANAADADARIAEQAALQGEPANSSQQQALREAGRASRIASAERVEAARRAEAAAIAEAAARREEREIAEANASARRQAARYAESEVRRRQSGLYQATQVPGQMSDPYTSLQHPQSQQPSVQQFQPPPQLEYDLHRPAPPQQHHASIPPMPITEPAQASAPVEAAPAPAPAPQPAPQSAPQPAPRPTQRPTQRRPQGYHPDEPSGVRPIYRPDSDGPQREQPVFKPTQSAPPLRAEASPQSRSPDAAPQTAQAASVNPTTFPSSPAAEYREPVVAPRPPAIPTPPQPFLASQPQPLAAEPTTQSTWPASPSERSDNLTDTRTLPRRSAVPDFSNPDFSNPDLSNPDLSSPAYSAPASALRGQSVSRSTAPLSSASRASTPFIPSKPADTLRSRRGQDDLGYTPTPDSPDTARRASSLSSKPLPPAGQRPPYTSEPTGPAWLYAPQTPPAPPAQQSRAAIPVAPPTQSSVADTLQHSRERVAARWFALKGVFEQPGAEQPEVPIRQKETRTPVLGVFSLAGGVGKTSLVATLGRALSSMGEKVLLTDTTSHGLLPFYFGASELRQGVVRTFSPPSGSTDAPIYLVSYDVDQKGNDEQAQDQLVEEIVHNSKGTHRILLDLTSSSGWVARRMARMNPTILVPVAPDMNSVISLQTVEKYFHGTIDSDGRPLQPFYVLNQFDASLPLHLDVREVLRRQLGDRLLPFVIRRAPAVSEALAEGMTVVDYAPDTPVAEDYLNTASWLRTIAAPATAGFRNVRWSER